MKKFFSVGAVLLIVGGLVSITANAATSKGGHYYYGNGSVVYIDSPLNSYASAHVIADNKTPSKITEVVAKLKTNGSTHKIVRGRYKAEITTPTSFGINECITGASDSAGYKETTHFKKSLLDK